MIDELKKLVKLKRELSVKLAMYRSALTKAKRHEDITKAKITELIEKIKVVDNKIEVVVKNLSKIFK